MSETWKINLKKIDTRLIREAAERVDGGQLVIFPTETVYGVAVNLESESALRRIYRIKKRPEEKPLTVHVADRSQVERWAEVSEVASGFMDRWWPGPLTLLLPSEFQRLFPTLRVGNNLFIPTQSVGMRGREQMRGREERIKGLAKACGGKLGFRFPDHPVALALLREVHCPVGAPSANRSGEPAPTTAMQAYEQLGELVDLILDAGPTPLECASTILDLTGDSPKLIREGAIPAELLNDVTCHQVTSHQKKKKSFISSFFTGDLVSGALVTALVFLI